MPEETPLQRQIRELRQAEEVATESTMRRAHAREGTRGVRGHRLRLPTRVEELAMRGQLDRLSYAERARVSQRVAQLRERAARNEAFAEAEGRELPHGFTDEEFRNSMFMLWPNRREFMPPAGQFEPIRRHREPMETEEEE